MGKPDIFFIIMFMWFILFITLIIVDNKSNIIQNQQEQLDGCIDALRYNYPETNYTYCELLENGSIGKCYEDVLKN